MKGIFVMKMIKKTMILGLCLAVAMCGFSGCANKENVSAETNVTGETAITSEMIATSGTYDNNETTEISKISETEKQESTMTEVPVSIVENDDEEVIFSDDDDYYFENTDTTDIAEITEDYIKITNVVCTDPASYLYDVTVKYFLTSSEAGEIEVSFPSSNEFVGISISNLSDRKIVNNGLGEVTLTVPASSEYSFDKCSAYMSEYPHDFTYYHSLASDSIELAATDFADNLNNNPKVDYVTIQGSRYSTSLTKLKLSNKYLTDEDIQPLSKLKKLMVLDLSSNKISDLTPLSQLTNLSELNLSYNKIDDISPLSNLTNLTILWASDNQISDISPLSNLTNLTILWASDNQISDISPLNNLTVISNLVLDSNQINDISPLSNLAYLYHLSLINNQISDISALSNLTYLTYLNLNVNQISDISPLSNLTNLGSLSLAYNQVYGYDTYEKLKSEHPNCYIRH